jgi:two-component system cell cycle sensor histidine kinase/response regulator CckA
VRTNEIVIDIELGAESGKLLPKHSGQTQVPNPQELGRGERILIVDDEPGWLEIGRAILSAGGYEVEVCEHSPDALLLIKQNPGHLDLVITDLNMPCIDGIELAAELQKVNAALPVVLTSAAPIKLTPAELRTAGIRDFLPKPWRPEPLFSIIRQAIGNRKQ